MKIFLSILIVTCFTSFAQAQQFNYKLDGPFVTSKTFKVQGNCEMCKHRIEGSIKNVPGIWASHWDVSSKTLTVRYDRAKINPAFIEKRVSAYGHDIDSMKASAEVYNSLPDCCQYHRKS